MRLCQWEEVEAEVDEMWSFVQSKQQQRWLWHAIDHNTGAVLAYVLSDHKDTAFLELKSLLEPFGITQFYTDGWGAYVGVACRRHHAILSLLFIPSAKPIDLLHEYEIVSLHNDRAAGKHQVQEESLCRIRS